MKGGYSYHIAYIKTKKRDITLSFAYSDEHGHAEVNVIEKVKRKYSNKQLKWYCQKYGGLVLEVVRISNSTSNFKPSFPCYRCQERINNCPGIVEVKFS